MSPSTIFALATPPGRSAIAVVRLSGQLVREVLGALCPPCPEPRRAVLRKVREPASGIVLDEALVLYFKDPRSETGEDVAEFQLHGGRAVVQAVLDAIAKIPGCRAAEPGEFARRAFANGKLDLAEIEGLADLIDAETEGQRRQAVAQASGVQSRRYEAWRSDLLTALGFVEAAIDFSDEGDISGLAVVLAEETARNLRADINTYLDDGHRGEILREGFRVVLAGPPNAGKSSLLNALARRDAAIVSEEAGTTRDVIEARLDLEGLAVIVADTAGIRETSSTVEQEGIRRTLAATRGADLVLWLTAVDDPAPTTPVENALVVLTKCDLPQATQMIHVKHPPQKAKESGEPSAEPADGRQPVAATLAVSAKTGTGLDGLARLIAERARAATGDASMPAINRARHRQELAAAILHLDRFFDDNAPGLELRAEDLRLATNSLARLTGRIDSEDVLGAIFSRFCIGK